VNRDSPLTEQLVAALCQTVPEGALQLLKQKLISLAEKQGTAEARDAALALAALGETGWVQKCMILRMCTGIQ
jgi:hypothetical protein